MLEMKVKVEYIMSFYNDVTDEVEIWLFINDKLTKFKKYLRDIK